MTNTAITLRLLAAPFWGAAFVMFLPFLGFALVGFYGAQSLWRAVARILLGRSTDSPHRA